MKKPTLTLTRKQPAWTAAPKKPDLILIRKQYQRFHKTKGSKFV